MGSLAIATVATAYHWFMRPGVTRRIDRRDPGYIYGCEWCHWGTVRPSSESVALPGAHFRIPTPLETGAEGSALSVHEVDQILSWVSELAGDETASDAREIIQRLPKGKGRGVRLVENQAELDAVYGELIGRGAQGIEWVDYEGDVVRTPDGVEVGYRPESKTGTPTVDVRIPNDRPTRIHFDEG